MNNWGEGWGDNGCFYIERDIDNIYKGNASLFSINSYIAYLNLSSTTSSTTPPIPRSCPEKNTNTPTKPSTSTPELSTCEDTPITPPCSSLVINQAVINNGGCDIDMSLLGMPENSGKLGEWCPKSCEKFC